jgi:hypothetical protein
MCGKIACLTVALSLLCGVAVGQQFYDPFSYSPGTNIPGYTEHVGDWKATGTQVQCQAGISSQTLILNAVQDQDACVETLATYDMTVPGIQRTGPILRFTGSGSSANYFYLKLQDNGGTLDGWDTYWVYYQGGSNVMTGTISPVTKSARARLQVIEDAAGVRVQVYIDTDLDGLWDIVKSTTTTNGKGVSGGIGINGARSALADDLKYFNATLYLNGTPKIGTAVTLPGRGSPNHGYIGACSFGHSGFPVVGGRSVPLSLEPLLFVTLGNALPMIFQSLQGRTDAQGDFTMSVAIPPVPALVGFTIWASAVTLSPTGIAEIAPDTEITFTQ